MRNIYNIVITFNFILITFNYMMKRKTSQSNKSVVTKVLLKSVITYLLIPIANLYFWLIQTLARL